jgi:RecA-family ATPase
MGTGEGNGLSQAISEVVGFDYVQKKPDQEPPNDFWEGADEFEKNTFNKKKNGKDYSAWRQGILAKDLEQEELKPIEWVVEGLIAPGLNLIAGKSKIGKSFGTLDLAYQVEVGGEWLEKKCSKGNVLYYSLEDGKRRCKNRWKAMGIKPQEAWYQFRDRKPRIPLLTMGLEEEIEDWIKNTPDRKLVVIDVYVKVKKTLGGYKLNSYENDNYNLQNLQTLATKYEIAIVLVHHITKRKEDDVFDEINGSTGIQSNMDSMIVISSDRTKGKNPILYCIPKDGEPQQFEIALNPKCIWENLGKPGMAALTKIQNAITKAMKDNSERTSKEIIVKVQVDNGKENWTDKHIQKEVTRLVEKSYLMKIKRGHYKQMPF